MGRKNRMTVHFYDSHNSEGQPLFKYLLTSQQGSRSESIRVNIVNLGPTDQAGVIPDAFKEVRTDDEETAFLAALALLESHHTGLRAASSQVTRKDASGSPADQT
jgi:hypothetical protein